MISQLKRLTKALPVIGPLLSAAWNAVRPKSRIEKLDRRDNKLIARILKRILTPESNCIDVGAHKGTFLEAMVRLAPAGRHLAFEPIPHLASELRTRFPNVTVHEVALNNQSGLVDFHLITQNPAFSGLLRRPDLAAKEPEQIIRVQTGPLDAFVPADWKVTLIKVDVEGAELQVFSGASRLLASSRPWVIFEHGSASQIYESTSSQLFDELGKHKLAIWRLDRWLDGRPPFSRAEFCAAAQSGEYWNFLAGPVPDTTRTSVN